MPWKSDRAGELSADNVERLFRNEIPAIRVPGFASAAECATLAFAAEQHGFTPYKNANPPIGHIGAARFEFQPDEKAGFRAATAAAAQSLTSIYAVAFDPFARLIEMLRHHAVGPIEVAHEEDVGNYAVGVFRRFENGSPVHIDFVPWEARGWKISEVTGQLTWNVYLTSPKEGATHIYDRAWEPADERLRLPGNYGYEDEVVKGARSYQVKPVSGELVMFNTRNFHQVLPAPSVRMSFGTFLGRLPSGKLWFWS